jgi:serine/threonine protein kinase
MLGARDLEAVLKGRFSVVAALHRSPVAVVYAAVAGDGRRVAIKTTPDDERARAERRAHRRLSAAGGHAHVGTALEAGPTWSVMPLHEGCSIHDLAPRLAPKYLRDLADAVAFLHRVGLVHRDIKPANFVFDPFHARGILIDLNTAIEEDPARPPLGPCGTFPYIAPEVVQGRSACSPASDVYSLGVVAFELLHRRPPPARHSALRRALVQGKLPPAPRRLIVRMLRSAPRDRTTAAACLRSSYLSPVGSP